MAVITISIEEFIELSALHPVLDVRSPGEYEHAHIPNVISFPLFSDEERVIVGTTYKQQSREAAIKIGLDYFGPKMRDMVEKAESILDDHKKNTDHSFLVHCWRGGMRSGGIAWLLDLYGFKVYKLQGGYKAYRNWVLAQFDKPYQFQIIGGYTGSGKTLVLDELRKKGRAVLDLEALANHKGSAFGGLGKSGQPSNEMFENLIATNLFQITQENPDAIIWVEDESLRIGNINTPVKIWNKFRTSPLLFMNIPFEKRLEYIIEDYGKHKKEQLINSIVRIQKRLGGLETKTAINFLLENDIKGAFEILLKYYDKQYTKSLYNRPELDNILQELKLDEVNAKLNVNQVLNTIHESRFVNK